MIKEWFVAALLTTVKINNRAVVEALAIALLSAFSSAAVNTYVTQAMLKVEFASMKVRMDELDSQVKEIRRDIYTPRFKERSQ